MSAPKKLLVFSTEFIASLLFLLITINYLPITVLAQGTTTQQPQNPQQQGQSSTTNVPLTPPSAQNWDANKQTTFTMDGMLCGFTSMMAGFNPCTTDGYPVNIYLPSKDDPNKFIPQTRIISNGVEGGALGAGTQFIAQMYNNPPASGVQYVASIVRDGVGIVNPAYAQVTGSGAAVINPVQKLWQVFRNIAYLAFIIVFIIVGLMIMFRRKLNPQTVIGIQQALPGLVVGLILVTFSFFIAGLFVDLAFLGSQLIGIVFLSQIGNDPGAVGHVNELLNSENIITIFSRFIASKDLFDAAGSVGNSAVSIIFQGTAGKFLQGLIGALASCLNPVGIGVITAAGAINPLAGVGVAGACLAVTGGATAAGGGFIVSVLVFVLLLIGLLQAMIRLLLKLIISYVSIILSTIFGPFLILWSAVPGQSKALELWWKSLLANALVFPAVFGLFLLVASILDVGGAPWYLKGGVTGEFNQALPLLGGTPVSFIKALLVYGLLLAAPGIPDFVKDALGAKPSQVFSQALGRNLGTGAKAAGLFGSTVGAGTYSAVGAGIEGGARGAKAGTGFWGGFRTAVRENLTTRFGPSVKAK